ncbi:MAG: glycosyltransferase [Planctomycetota bacterium]|jgi:uncharacterized membrane protein YdjX (TVP38/TMEM64 family)
MKLCAVIPVHNEEAAIRDVVRGARKYCAAVVVVDDGSSDRTSDTARQAGATVLRLPRKSGKGTAMRRGFSHALENGFDAVVTLDGDGQHDPAEIPRLVLCAEQRNESLVIGSRMANSSGMPRARWFCNWLSSKYLSLGVGCTVRDTQCGFRLIRTDLLRKLSLKTRRFDIESEVLVEANQAGVHPCEVPIHCVYRDVQPTHNYMDVVRVMTVYGRRHSHWRGCVSMVRFLWEKSRSFFLGALKVLSLPVLVLLAVLVLAEIGGGSLTADRERMQAAILGMGILAPLIFVALCTLKPLVLVPFSGLAIVAGTVFGLLHGTLLVAAGGITGAVVGFYFARVYGRSLIERYISRRFPKAEEWMAREGWAAVLFLRLLNVPWDWVSYAAGLSKIRFRPFMLATLIAVLPIAFIGTFLGASIWSFPSAEFFLAFGVIIAFGTATFLVRRAYKLSRAA